jgi:hypothetical protein
VNVASCLPLVLRLRDGMPLARRLGIYTGMGRLRVDMEKLRMLTVIWLRCSEDNNV